MPQGPQGPQGPCLGRRIEAAEHRPPRRGNESECSGLGAGRGKQALLPNAPAKSTRLLARRKKGCHLQGKGIERAIIEGLRTPKLTNPCEGRLLSNMQTIPLPGQSVERLKTIHLPHLSPRLALALDFPCAWGARLRVAAVRWDEAATGEGGGNVHLNTRHAGDG